MSLDDDARAFGQHFQGGWQLGLLVARNVYKQAGVGRPPKSEPVRNKVSCAEFAKMAGVSERTVQWYCNTWKLAAEAGYCTPADELAPGVEDPKLTGIDLDSHEFRELWRKCYREARDQRGSSTAGQENSGRRHSRSSTPRDRADECNRSAANGPFSAESESNRADGECDETTDSTAAHPLYGLLLALNHLSDELKRSAPPASIIAAATTVAHAQHRAALRRAIGVL